MSKATELIERSVARDEIAYGTYDEDTALDLWGLADDSVENGDVDEYWGVDDDGETWCVHLERRD